MAKTALIKILFLILYFFFTSCSETNKQLELNHISQGSLNNNEYDYYTLTIPEEFEKDSHLIIELEPNKELDSLQYIISDPNLYISTKEKKPSIAVNTWKSDRFGDETIAINPSYLKPFQDFYISVHCKEKCNYIIKAQLLKDIIIEENEIYNFNLNPNTVTKFSFTTKDYFDELHVNIFGSYTNTFNVYCHRNNPSSTNTLISYPILFNGYRFNITKYNNLRNLNTNTKFHLVIDNEEKMQSLTIWLQYGNENIEIKEADILYDSIEENKANCYYYYIDSNNKNKDIVLSTNLFGGYGFLHIAGYNLITADSITLSDKNEDYSYNIYQNKAILLTENNFEELGVFKKKKEKLFEFLLFC